MYTSLAAVSAPPGGVKQRSMSVVSTVSESHELFSRGLRFKLQEDLSRDAAQLSSKVTALRHGHVATTGKVLDKLIEDSRNPVPEAMLDEQDSLEERCANELDAIGRFLMAVVSQWKKYDIFFCLCKTAELMTVVGRMKSTTKRKRISMPFADFKTSWPGPMRKIPTAD